jgi:hypothetical protein
MIGHFLPMFETPSPQNTPQNAAILVFVELGVWDCENTESSLGSGIVSLYREGVVI